MTTYVMRNGELIEKHLAPPKSGALQLTHGVMPDIRPFLTQDGKEISSRSGLRAYEQANGVKQIGNDMASFHSELRQKVYGEQQ